MSWFAKRFAARAALAEGTRQAITAPSGVTLGATAEGTPVCLRPYSREHSASLLVMGSSGAGKSLMVSEATVAQIVEGDDETATVCVDPKGDVVLGILQAIARARPQILRSGRVKYLNPFAPGLAFPFNLLRSPLGQTTPDVRARTLAQLTGVLTAQQGQRSDGGLGVRQVELLSAAYEACFALRDQYPEASLLWSIDALQSPEAMKLLARAVPSPRLRETLMAKYSDDLLVSCASRTRLAWASSAGLARSTSAPGCLSFEDLTAPGSITLIDLGHPLGGTAERSFYASVIVRLVVDHLYAVRPSPFAGHHCQLVIDEAAQVATVLQDVAEMVLQTGRSRRIGLTAMSQGASALDRAAPGLLETLHANVPMTAVGRLGSAADAERFARVVAPAPGSSERPETVRLRLASALANLPPRTFYVLGAGARQRFTTKTVDVGAGEAALRSREAELRTIRSQLALPLDGPDAPTLRDVLSRSPTAVAPAAAAVPARRPVAPALAVDEVRPGVVAGPIDRPASTPPADAVASTMPTAAPPTAPPSEPLTSPSARPRAPEPAPAPRPSPRGRRSRWG